MASLRMPGLFDALAGCERVLIAGAGGGFDVYAGLPLAMQLHADGVQVHLANLSFADLAALDTDVWLEPDVAAVGPLTKGLDGYFPERTLALWLAANGLPPTVYAFSRVGVQPLRAAYQALVDRLKPDAIVLVDGGTDILMRGDEAGLGTPEEDMSSLAAAAALDVAVKLVVCLGFGIDAYHGVNHVQVLENLAELDQAGSYLGALSIPGDSPQGLAYVNAVAHARALTPGRPSIVNGQIAAALEGRHGNVQFTTRTGDSRLFVNPLMAVYFTVDLAGLAARNLLLDRIEHTVVMWQVSAAIEEFRNGTDTRIPQAFPH
ncbi:hypothetical protein Cme02nite_27820 [Catellatospora methionotrophica]|uniref:DUF1152 domain-containing protein n=1 Tax=Catellatospora methionotrophica TaxID=121620 RepID=A0A8J3L8Z3_9ACTN|nr:DUF1152 domain-containing protein [Catellatospora methionotrophica]GIG14450.1 hypothetical protein Cme02nite_27820 [Catellatospora methionotrophica]